MLKYLSWVISKTGGLFNRISRLCYYVARKIYKQKKSLRDQNIEKWYAIDGDATLRVQYRLNQDSVVFDVGGFEGDWTAEIAARYNPHIFVFEPVARFVDVLENRFSFNPKIQIYPMGLSDSETELSIHVMSESSSVFRDSANHITESIQEKIRLVAFDQFMQQHNLDRVDLIKINIEGGEYPLLEHMIQLGWVKRVDHLQIQFHDFVENADARMNQIKHELAKTHRLVYEYVYAWESWEKIQV